MLAFIGNPPGALHHNRRGRYGMSASRVSLVAAVGVAALLAGCSSSKGTSASTTTAPSTPASSAASSAPAAAESSSAVSAALSGSVAFNQAKLTQLNAALKSALAGKD